MTMRRRSRVMVTPVTPDGRWIAIRSSNLDEFSEARMFSHTQNENGTYNTRCLNCLMTVASAIETPEELDTIEAQHMCPEKALAELLARGASQQLPVHSH